MSFKHNHCLRDDYSLFQIHFARAEALHAHGHTKDACRLARQLAEEMLTNPPDLIAETANLPTVKGMKTIIGVYLFLWHYLSYKKQGYW